MGYVLHLIDASSNAEKIDTINTAERFISASRHLTPISHPKFTQFVQAMIKIYPDLSEEDEDGDNDENLWEEGLDELSSYGPIKEIVVKVEVTDETVINHLKVAAFAQGLLLYDAEGQILYAP